MTTLLHSAVRQLCLLVASATSLLKSQRFSGSTYQAHSSGTSFFLLFMRGTNLDQIVQFCVAFCNNVYFQVNKTTMKIQ